MNATEPEFDDLPREILDRCVRDFGRVRGPEVHELLLRAIAPNAFGQSPARLMRCILYSAGGDEQRLQEGIDLCRADYRDLIVGAEYDGEVQVREFHRPFGSG